MNNPARRGAFFPSVLVSLAVLVLLAAPPVHADGTYQTLPFTQNWSNAGLITTADSWSGVPGIIGFRGDGLTAATDVDARTIVAADEPGVIDVNPDLTNPDTNTTGGIGEFAIANPVVAFQGSGTADAPYLLLHLNTTGQTNITLSFNARDIDGAADDAVQQVAVLYRVGAAGTYTSIPLGYVADATTGPSLATLVTPVSVVLPAACENQAQVQIRILTTNATGSDEWVGIDDISVTAGAGATTLTVGNATVTEGNAGTVTAAFTVSLSAPAGAGGVTFDIATADGTATTAGSDYVASSLTSQVIAAGSSTYTFNVTVNGDTTIEPNETFFVNVTNVTGAVLGDGQGLGTITTDDFPFVPIHDIQGPTGTSPLNTTVVSTRGIVTGLRSAGFYIQEPDATVDADPLTSEGIYVYTGGAPPAAAVIGASVLVTGTVAEYAPGYLSLTELTTPSVVQVSTGNPLPAPIALTTTFPSPAGAYDQLERLEGMRVSVASFTVSAPTDGNPSNNYTTGSSNGVFFGVVTGVNRPFREDGIAFPKNPPTGTTIPPLLRFDSNPELISVDSNAQTGTVSLDLSARTVVTGLVGPLDYSFDRYTILPDLATPPTVLPEFPATAVTAPIASEITVGSYNLQRFFDTANDPATDDPVLTAAQYDFRLTKASLGIRNSMRTPDVVGVIEVENLSTLQALATRINSDAVAASQPDPLYVAYLVEGNDIGGIDVGFLVKTAPVVGTTPRVEVLTVTQELDGTLFVNADASTETLNDRPPLMLRAIVHGANGGSYPVTVLVNHLRSLNDVDNDAPGSSGWATVGARVRAKRHAQAVDLATFLQNRQVAYPAENVVVVGDFNSFSVNDSLGHSVATIAGTPVVDATTAVPGDGVDLVNPDLVNLGPLGAAAERYSYVYDSAPQMIDHALVNAALVGSSLARRVEFARINADFPEIDRSTADRRLSDHDPLVVFVQTQELAPTIITATKSASSSIYPGGPLTYTIILRNNGATAQLDNPGNELIDVLPATLTLVSASATSGTAVATVATNTVTWNGAIPAGGTVTVTILAQVGNALAIGTTITNQATVSYDSDGNGTNETSVLSDDPGTGTGGDPTTVTVTLGADGVAVVPALDGVGLGLLTLLVALGGSLVLGRRLS
jgi:hypothetical protein